ncbi:hypothetical protein, conserved [Eimeria maxima]|uniref:SAP domain-containing protein n=1 Tax=Eimeria maxima TaxID=5804 RepID=U6M8M4_EIMMA|nr:hypothetical protein, conserved [Eimeria maxima]CDJ59423.1 hypothetical protein, conserved [Eimeria maxima]
MDLLLTVKATSRKLRLRRSASSLSDSVSSQLNTVSDSAACRPQKARRLALKGAPAPYFAVNPHLFEDPQLWTTEQLRRLCSELGCSACGSRSALVERLQDLDWDPTTGVNLECLPTEICEQEQQQHHRDDGAINMRPPPGVCTPAGIPSVLHNPAGGPALLQRETQDTCSSSDGNPPPASTAKSAGQISIKKKADRNQRGNEASSATSGRGTKRKRQEQSIRELQKEETASPPRKQIKFCPFNNIQLITTDDFECDGASKDGSTALFFPFLYSV